MSGATSIEWTDRTVNPIRARNLATGAVGHFCEKVSPGCKNCYASTWNERVRPIATKNGQGHLIGTGLTFDVRNRDKVETFLDDAKLLAVIKRKEPTKFFWCDMTDMFGEWVRDEWIDRCFAAMAVAGQHVHQVLTKRADRMRDYMASRSKSAHYWKAAAREFGYALEFDGISLVPFPLPNVWLGISAEDQQRADERIPLLLETPAAIRFVSAEPLLGPLNLRRYLLRSGVPGICADIDGQWWHDPGDPKCGNCRPAVDWVIPGGESGAGARWHNVSWTRSIVRDCKAAGVAVFVKQLGARVLDRNDAGFDGCGRASWPEAIEQRDAIENNPHGYREEWQGADVRVRLVHKKGGDPSEWPEDLRGREFPKEVA